MCDMLTTLPDELLLLISGYLDNPFYYLSVSIRMLNIRKLVINEAIKSYDKYLYLCKRNAILYRSMIQRYIVNCKNDNHKNIIKRDLHSAVMLTIKAIYDFLHNVQNNHVMFVKAGGVGVFDSLMNLFEYRNLYLAEDPVNSRILYPELENPHHFIYRVSKFDDILKNPKVIMSQRKKYLQDYHHTKLEVKVYRWDDGDNDGTLICQITFV